MRDIIIIGAGGGGAVIAKELAARGLDVLLLEAGPRHLRPELEWSRLEIDANSPLTGYLRFGPADRTKPAWRRELPQNSAISQVSGVGGTTQHYFANSPRAMPGVFNDYTGADAENYDTAHLFPFGYRELIPYYEWVERTLPVETSAMGTKEDAFFRGAEGIGLPVQTTKDIIRAAFRPQENAILQPRGNAGRTDDPNRVRFPLAQGCTFCGHCLQGCLIPRGAPRNLKAKRSTDNSYVPMALTADLWARGGKAITLVTDAFATRIGTDGNGEARSVTWRIGATGETFTEEARVIVMACGGIETPRLWLQSQLPNPNDWVGRGMTDHFLDGVIGVMPRDIKSAFGPASGARADFPGHGMFINAGFGPAFAAAVLTFSDGGIAGAYNNGLPNDPHGADAVGRLIGPALKNVLANLNHLLNIPIFTDDNVEPQNRVMLSDTAPPDEHGAIPRVIMRQRNRSPRTIRNREFLVEQAVRLCRAAGATAVYRINLPPWLFHIHSTMRMGMSADNSVVDANAEARWVKRLFIADNSALSNSLGGPNPTLTTQALATRTAEKVFQLYFEGDPWVGRETPMSSIDAVVTRAVIERGL
ncbi:MAG: GMC oxidoreductase [Verrucomicrobia subdivision 3 bacterium]|nr:GMC oxidoreductase [Limisphaerales bacterium]